MLQSFQANKKRRVVTCGLSCLDHDLEKVILYVLLDKNIRGQ